MTATQRARAALRRRRQLETDLRTSQTTAARALAEVARLQAHADGSHRGCVSLPEHMRMTHRADIAEARVHELEGGLRRLGAFELLDVEVGR